MSIAALLQAASFIERRERGMNLTFISENCEVFEKHAKNMAVPLFYF